jgi:hypothetical protein
MMRLLSSVLVFLLACAAPVLSAEPTEWGKPVNGLRMAVALVDMGAGEPQVVEVTIENVGNRTLVVQIGRFGDTRRLALQAGSDAGAQWAGYAGFGEGVSGSPQQPPFLVPLPPGSRYQIRRPTGDYVMTNPPVTLGKFLLGPGPHWLRADLRVGGKPDPLFPGLAMEQPLPKGCVAGSMLWQGTLSSNILRSPARRQR